METRAESISISHDGYEPWLRERAERLADVGNGFLAELAPPARLGYQTENILGRRLACRSMANVP
jgi:hypothetical protein